MNTNKDNAIFAYALTPGVDTFRGGLVKSVSGPHMMPQGRCVKVSYLGTSPLRTPALRDEYVLTMTPIEQS